MPWPEDDNLTALERLATRATTVALCLAALFLAVVLYRVWR